MDLFEVTIPTTVDAPDAADFVEAVGVRNAVEADGFGTEAFSFTPAETLPRWLDQKHHPGRMFAARVDGRIVARGFIETIPDGDGTGWIGTQVLPAHRRAGIGTALADRLEAVAREWGLTKVIVYTVSKSGPGPRLDSPTGFGSVPRDNGEVRFLRGRGYQLEQVERASLLELPVDVSGPLESALSESGADYRLHTWIGDTPPQWRSDIATLLTRMSTDAPTAGLEEPEDVWTVDRLLESERLHAADPRTELFAAVEHVPTGRLAGFTVLNAPRELDRAVGQEDTLVLREHRGHRLGMLLKLANLAHLQEQKPGHPVVVTFNAEENRYMLSVNEAVGFTPIGHEGAWKKELS